MRSLEAGANDYMPKPVNVKILHVRLLVAERLLTHPPSLTASGSRGRGRCADGKRDHSDRQALIASAIEATEAPIAMVQAGGDDSSFTIVYSNAALTSTTQFLGQDELVGKSLADLEAWTPEFQKMTMGFIKPRRDPFPRVPLWEQDAPGSSGLPEFLSDPRP